MTSTPPPRLRDPGASGIFRRALLVAAGQGSVALLFGAYILAARFLGDAGFGTFSLGLTIATVLVMIPAWGSRRYSAIIAARDPSRTEEILATNLGLTLPLSLLYLPLVGGAALLLTGDSTVAWVAVLLGGDLLAREFGNVLRSLLRVHDGYDLDVITNFGERGAIVICALISLMLFPDPLVLAGAFVLGRTLGAVLTAILFIRRVCPIRIRFPLAELRRLFVAGTPLALRQGLSFLTFRMDMLFLGAMRSSQEVGWYGSVYTLMEGAVLLPHAVTGALGPTLSANHGAGRRDVVLRLYQRGLKYILIVGLFLGAVLGILRDPIVALLFGSGFARSGAALGILSIAVVFIFLRVLTTEVLDSIDLRAASAWIFLAALVLNGLLNLLLIPQHGYLGAAAATVATEALLFVGTLGSLHLAGYPAQFFQQFWPPALSILPAAGLLHFFSPRPILALPAAGAVYLAGLTLLGNWDDKDRSLVRGLTARLRHR